jgi:hypothetical protein
MTDRTEVTVQADAVIADDMDVTDSGTEYRVAGTPRRANNGNVLHLRRAADDAEAQLPVLPDERATIRRETAVLRQQATGRAAAAHL